MVNATNYVLSLPLILLALFAVGTLVMDRMFPPEWKWMNSMTALVGLAFTAGGVAKIQYTQAQLELSGIRLQVGFLHSMVVDSFALYFYYLLLAGAALSVLMVVRRAPPEQAPGGAFYSALLCALIGMMCMVSGFNLALIFGGLVLSELACYGLVHSLANDPVSRKAAGKYLRWKTLSCVILGAGFVVLWRLTRHAGLHEVRQVVGFMTNGRSGGGHHFWLISALGLTTAGLVLKIAAVPFDGGYSGDSAVSGVSQNCAAGFLSVAGPVSTWAMALHIFLWGLYPLRAMYAPLLIWSAIVALTVGFFAVLVQSSIRRALAYSSLGHAGYMFLGLAAAVSVDAPNPAMFNGLKSLLLYLPAIVFMNAGAFAVLASLRRNGADDEADVAGLFFRAPAFGIFMLIFLLSIAGIPPLAGFYGKYFAFLSLQGSGHFVLAWVGLLFAVFGLFSYFRFAKTIFTRPDGEPVSYLPASFGLWAAALLTAAATVFLGVYPQLLIRIANWSLHLG